MRCHLAVLLFALPIVVGQSPYPNYFGNTFSGDGTYYGNQGGGGHCTFQGSDAVTQPWTTGLTGPLYVALDRPLYYDDNGACAACGMCIAMYGENPDCTVCGGNPVQSSVEYVMVADECPECSYGSLDQGAEGDGRWQIHWHAVQCDVQNTPFHYAFQGSNDYYVKLTVTNTRVPIESINIQVNGGGFAAMTKTADNFFVLFSAIAVQWPAAVEVTSIFGDTVTDMVPVTSSSAGPTPGAAQFPFHPELETVGGAPSVTDAPSCGRFCGSEYTYAVAAQLPPTAVSSPPPAPGVPSAPPVPVASPPPSPFTPPPPAPTIPAATTEASSPSPPAPAAITMPAATPASITSSACSIPISPYSQCGGSSGLCVNIGQCVDAPWTGACCSSGFTCQRTSQWWWQCDRAATAVPSCGASTESVAGRIADYEACGGYGPSCTTNSTSADATLPPCRDGPWVGFSCQAGFLCARWDARTWQCREVPRYVSPRPAGQTSTESNKQVPINQASYCKAKV